MSLLLLWSFRATATILLGLLLTLSMRRRSAAVRSVALRATLLAAWFLPVAALVAPRVEIALPQPAPTSGRLTPLGSPSRAVERSRNEAPTDGPPPTPALLGSPTLDSAVPSSSPLPKAPTTSAFLPWIEAAYLAITSGLILRWLLAMGRLRRIVRAANPMESGVALTPELNVPVTFCLLRPCILLPESSKSWPETRTRAAILHEQAHVRRRDWAWQTLAALFAALHWANPLAWLLVRALRDVAEAAADDEVLSHMGPSEYARELLAVAETARPAGPALAMARRGGVRDRVVAILAANRDRRRPTLATGGFLLLVILMASLAVAGVRRVAGPTQAKTLAGGLKIEIVGLCDYNTAHPEAWSPDGKPMPAFVSWIGPDVKKPNGRRDIQMMVRTTSGGGEKPTVRLFSPREAGFYVESFRTSNDPYTDLTWSVSQGESFQNLRLGVASGPWKPYRGPEIGFKAGRQPPKGREGSASGVWLRFPFPAELTRRDVRIAALLNDGRRIQVAKRDMGPVPLERTNGASMAVRFNGKDPSAFQKLEFEYRDYEIAEFPNVAVRPQRSTSTPREVALTEIVGRDDTGNLATWDGDGKPLPPTTDGNPFSGLEPEGGERLVRLRFALDGPNGGDPSVRFVVPSPVRTGAWGAIPLGTNQAMVVLHVPKAQRATDVRMGVADGPWRRFDESFVRRPYTGSLRKDLHGIEVLLPLSLKKEAVELRAYAGSRKLDPYTVMSSPDDTTATLVLQGDPNVTRFEIWHRPYRWHEFRFVPLVPPAGPAYGPFALTDGTSAELVGVWTPGVAERAWRPDGTPSALTPPGSYDATVPIDRRGVLLAFRLRGPHLGGDPSARVLEAAGLRGSSLSALVFEGSGRLLWQMTTVPIAVRSADADVEFDVGRWDVGGVMGRGTAMGQASWRVDGSHVVSGVRYTALTVRPHLFFSPTRTYELTPLDPKGNTVESFGRSMNADQTFTFSLTHPERVARWRFESRPREVVRFRDVRLVPTSNP